MLKELNVTKEELEPFRQRLGQLYATCREPADKRLYLFMTLCILFVESRRNLGELQKFAEQFERPLTDEEVGTMERLRRRGQEMERGSDTQSGDPSLEK